MTLRPRMTDALARERILRAMSEAHDPSHVDTHLIALAHVAEVAREALVASAEFEGMRPTDRELASGQWQPGAEETHRRAVNAEWRLRYLVGLERHPLPGVRIGDAVARLGSGLEPRPGWQARVLAELGLAPRLSWWRRAWRWLSCVGTDCCPK